MTTQLFAPPPTFDLPLTKGNDLYFGIVYKPIVLDDEGQPVLDIHGKPKYDVADYPTDATVSVTIETTPQNSPDVVLEATIDGSVATIWGDYVLVDSVLAGRNWRAVISYEDGLDRVLCNGRTSRHDG